MQPSNARRLSSEVKSADDTRLTATIRQRLGQEKGLIPLLPEVTTRHGIVRLSGSVLTPQARHRAGEIASSVEGVGGVRNHLTLCPAAAPAPARPPRHRAGRTSRFLCSDERLTAHIRELLACDIRVDAGRVQVAATGQLVRLSGTVSTAAEKACVVATAYQAGATHVEDHDLLVAYWFAYRADDYIAQVVRDAFHADPQLPAAAPLVQVHEGIVTLAGVVPTLQARQHAEQIAHQAIGVRAVHNLLKVRAAYPTPDATIGRQVTEALALAPDLSRFRLQVRVQGGQVELTGTVGSAADRQRAEYVAAGSSGVTVLDNQLTVLSDPGLADVAPFCLGTAAGFPSLGPVSPAVGHFLLT